MRKSLFSNCPFEGGAYEPVLTLQHERQIYLLADTPQNRVLIHRYIDLWEYPDGRLQIQADDASLTMSGMTGWRWWTPRRSSRTSGWAMHCRWLNLCKFNATTEGTRPHREHTGRTCESESPEATRRHQSAARHDTRGLGSGCGARCSQRSPTEARPAVAKVTGHGMKKVGPLDVRC